MIKEIELEYTVYTLAKLSREVWGDNAVEYLSARIDSITTHDQMKSLIDSLKDLTDDDEDETIEQTDLKENK
jgi:uncharacterized protein (UPF0305 family)